MILPSHTIKSKVFIEKYDKDKNLIEERELYTGQKMDAFIEAKKISENGELIETNKYPFRSWTKNFMQILSSSLGPFNSDSIYITQYNGATPSTPLIGSIFNYSYNIPAKYQYSGIILGKNTDGISTISADSSSFSDYYLKNKISHGFTSGTLFHGDSIYTPVYTSGSYDIISHGRFFSNQSTESINIGEIGITGYSNYGSISNTQLDWILLARDVKDYTGSVINIDLGANQSLFVNYNFLLETSSLFPNYNWMKLCSMNGYGYAGPVENINPVGLKNLISYRNSERTGSIVINLSYTYIISSMARYELECQNATGYTASLDWYKSEKWLKMSINGTLNTCYRSCYAITDTNLRDFDITYLTNSTTASYSYGFAARITRTDNANIAGLFVSYNSSSLRLMSNTNNSSNQTIISTSVAKTYDANTDYYIRFFLSESIARVKSWISGTAEPGGWEIDTTVSNTERGYLGYVPYKQSVEVNPVTYFNDISLTYLEIPSQSQFGPTPIEALRYNMSGTSTYTRITQVLTTGATATNNTAGIVVGTSDLSSSNELISSEAFSHWDWRLNNQIPQGNNVGQLHHTDTTVYYVDVTPEQRYIEINRTLMNNANYTAYIREIGLYSYYAWHGADSFNYSQYKGNEICIGRVSPGTPITLTNGQSVLIRMRLYFDT